MRKSPEVVVGRRVLALAFVLVVVAGGASRAGDSLVVGEPVAGALSAAGEVDAFTFVADPGARVFLDRLEASDASDLNWRLVDRWRRPVVSNLTDMGDLGPVVLQGGAYMVEVFAEGNETGTYSFVVREAPVTTEAVAIGASVSGSIDPPGVERRYTFEAAPSERVFIDFTATTNANRILWRLEDARGRVIRSHASVSLTDVGPIGLQGGDYVLVFSASGDFTASYAFDLVSVVDTSADIAVEELVESQVDMPGQTRVFSFESTLGERVVLDAIASSDANRLNWSLEDPLGREIVGFGANFSDLGPFTLAAGTHTITVTGEFGATPSFSFRVESGSDSAFSTSLGATESGSIAPADRHVYTFSVDPGRVVTLDVISTTNFAGLNWVLEDPRGRNVLERTTSLADSGPLALVGGTYTLTILGEGASSGDYEFAIVDGGTTSFVPEGTAVALGDVVEGQVAVAGGEDRYTFVVSGEERVFLDLLQNTTNLDWELLDPAGQRVVRKGATSLTGGDAGPWSLAAGVYTLILDARGTATPTYSFRVVEVVDTLEPAALGASIVGDFTGAAGAKHIYDLPLPVDTRVFFDWVQGASTIRWSVYDPRGEPVVESARGSSGLSDLGPYDLAAGVYRIEINPDASAEPSYELRPLPVTDSSQGVTLGEPIVGDFVGEAGSRRSFVLTLAEERRVVFDLVSGNSSLVWSAFDEEGEALFQGQRASVSTVGDRGPYDLGPGVYTLVLDPDFANTPAYSIVLREVLDSVEPLELGPEVSGVLAVSGQRAIFELTASEGQRLFFGLTAQNASLRWSLIDPVGTPVFLEARAERVGQDDRGPFDLVAGDYRLILQGTTGAVPAYDFRVENRERDLRVARIAVDPPSLTTGDIDRTLAIEWTVENLGGGDPVVGSWADRVVASLDDELGNEDDVLVTTRVRKGPLAARDAYVDSTTYEVPVDFAGQLRLFVEVDVADEVDEVGGESNNLASRLYGVVPEGSGEGRSIRFDLADGTEFPVGSTVALSGIATAIGGNATVLYVLDASRSTDRTAFDANFDGVVDELDDLDGDGDNGTIFDAELGSVLRIDEIVSASSNVRHGLVIFAGDAVAVDLSPLPSRQLFWSPVDDDRDEDGVADFRQALLGVDNGSPARASLFTPVEVFNGQTNFVPTVEVATETLLGAGESDQRVVIFLTDGDATDSADLEAYRALGAAGVTFRGFQINNRAVSPSLQLLADVVAAVDGSTGSARSVEDAGDLLFEIVNSFRVVAVLVDGVPADSVDAAGRFFHLVTIEEPGDNVFTVEVIDASGGSFEASITLVGVESGQEPFDALTDVTGSVEARYSDTTLDRVGSRLRVQAEACNVGGFPIDGPLLMVVDRFSEPDVSPLNPDGFTPDGRPYFVFLDQTVSASLEPAECSVSRTLVFDTPSRRRVDFDVSWVALGNHAPTFSSVPATTVVAGRTWAYAATASDPEGHVVSWSLEEAPSGATIDPESGLAEWPTVTDDIGTHSLAVVADDGRGGRATQRFRVEVVDGAPNRPPVFSSTPPTRAAIGAAYRYTALATDVDGDPVAFEKAAGPEGLAVSALGEVEWSFALPGEHVVGVRALDGRGGVAEQTWTLAVGVVSTNPSAPTLLGEPSPLAAVGNLYFYQPVADDPDPGDELGFSITEGPDGLVVDPDTGRVTWIPTEAQTGVHAVTLRVTDSGGATASQSWSVEVLPEPGNRPPVVESVPPLFGFVGETYEYVIVGSDPDGENVTYTLVAGPKGMVVDPSSGELTWTPSAVGTVLVGVRALDGSGAHGTQVWEIDVTPPNVPPMIVSDPVVDAVVGGAYRYDADAVDANGDALAWSVTRGPTDMTIDRRTGLVTWTPGVEDIGDHGVSLLVDDGKGGVDVQKLVITVRPDVAAPVVSVIASREPARVGEAVTLCVRASDDVGVASRSLSVDGKPVDLDDFGCAAWTPPAVGTVTLVGRATDPAGNLATAKRTLQVVSDVPTGAPVVTLVAPSAGSILSEPTEIVVTITDDVTKSPTWTVELAADGEEEFVLLAEGAGRVVEEAVALLDTTRLANGVYTLRVVASDGKQTGGVEFQCSVSGELKLGNFTLEVVDLTVPFFGLGLSVSRRYDSLDPRPGDFGAGWRLGLPGDVVDSARESKTGNGLVDLFSNEPFRVGTRVYVTLPDGRRAGFSFDPQVLGFPFPLLARPTLRGDEGVEDTLEVLQPAGNVFLIGGVATQVGIPYNPTRYRLTTRDGVEYTIDESLGLQRIVDADGNTIDVTPDGLLTSSGVGIEFRRDRDGRIERVIEPDDPDDGREPAEIVYSYDALGNLRQVTDRGGVTTEYRYESPVSPHYLTEVVDPTGRQTVRTVYDDEGRLVARCGPEGDLETLDGCLAFEFDAGLGATTIFDGRGARTDLVLDALGNIVLETRYRDDGSVVEIASTFDEAGRLLTRTLSGDEAFVFERDERGMPVSRSDPSGRAWTFTYGTCGELELGCDPDGNCSRFVYDDACRLVEAIDPLGAVTRYEYDERGNRERIIDAVGNTWRFEHDAAGNISRVFAPDGGVTVIEVDRLGRPVAHTDAAGRTIEYEYDDAGNRVLERWDDGSEIAYEYDDAGRLARASGPSGMISVDYWSDGRIRNQTTDWGPGSTPVTLTYGHDDGGEMRRGYDGNGNLTHVSDSLGGVTEYRYDALNRLATIVQSGDGVRPKRVDLATNDAGRITDVERFSDLAGTTLVAGTTYTYGCRSCELDLLGIEHFGPLGEVLDGLVIERDGNANVVAVTDGEGVHRYTYDGVSRLLEVDRPVGSVLPDESYSYDAVGNRQSSHRSAESVFAYEAGGELGGNALLADDVHDYFYDEIGNLRERRRRDTGEVRRLSYDHRNRLIAIVDLDASEAVLHEVRIGYDIANRRHEIEVDGELTRIVYDGRNPILFLDEAGEVVSRRLYGRAVDGVLAEEVAGTTRWLLSDHVGTPRVVVDEAGAVVELPRYDSFGVAAVAASGGVGFAARDSDGASGLSWFRARDYDPSLGRFLQADPLIPYRYDYAENNPLKAVDPLGLGPALEYAAILIGFTETLNLVLCTPSLTAVMSWGFCGTPCLLNNIIRPLLIDPLNELIIVFNGDPIYVPDPSLPPPSYCPQ